MKHNINELTAPFVAEDPNWNIPVLKLWLVRKKGIPEDIADYAIQAAFIEIDDDSKRILTHHGPKGFDNFVLSIAQEFLLSQAKLSSELMEAKLKRKINEALVSLDNSVTSKLSEMEEKVNNLGMGLSNTVTELTNAVVDKAEGAKQSLEEKLSVVEGEQEKKFEELRMKYGERIEELEVKYEEKIGKLEKMLEVYSKGSKIGRAWRMVRGKI